MFTNALPCFVHFQRLAAVYRSSSGFPSKLENDGAGRRKPTAVILVTLVVPPQAGHHTPAVILAANRPRHRRGRLAARNQRNKGKCLGHAHNKMVRRSRSLAGLPSSSAPVITGLYRSSSGFPSKLENDGAGRRRLPPPKAGTTGLGKNDGSPWH